MFEQSLLSDIESEASRVLGVYHARVDLLDAALAKYTYFLNALIII